MKKEKKVDIVEYAEKLFLSTDWREAEEKQRQKEREEFEEERDIERYACFIRAMLSYFCNVNGKEMAKDLFDVEINNWDEDDAGGYHSDNFKIMQKDLYRFLGKCDDKRTRAIAKQSMKYLRGEK